MIYTSDLAMIIIYQVHISPQSSREKWKRTVAHIVWKIIKRIDLFLDKHSTEYIWQLFYMFNNVDKSV